ncbi:MAG TPA: M1 family metallopeptidase [Gemmatimonadales bacterium]|nr:M1 family metallopeptidase [Gemmatimonadales bacterium]
MSWVRTPFPCTVRSTLATVLLAAPLPGVCGHAQTQPALTVTPAVARPLPGPVYESVAFTRAVARGTRTRSGIPGRTNWVQHARYTIAATLDVSHNRLEGRETVVYLNHSPDSLRLVVVYLRQNVFVAGSPRREAAPVTGGVKLERVALSERTLVAGDYAVDGTVMRIPLPDPLLPGDSVQLGFTWSYTPPPAPADGREGHEDHVYFMGYWYPQIAVYDDVDGWVTDPYLLQAEFYMDPADYDVRVTVPRGWVVGATGSLRNADSILSPAARDSLAAARTSGRVVRVVTPGALAARAFAAGQTTTWHFAAADVRDFAWGTSDQYVWERTRALVGTKAGAALDTVDINSFFRLSARAAAWRVGAARFTRDAVEELSAYLWPYPYPQMTSMEGVLSSGGMEYPMVTLMQPWADTLSLAGDLMHETGHMWFPMQVGSNETRHPWMDEGLTQFDAAQGMRALYGEPRSGGRPNDSEAGQRALYLGAVRAGNDAPLMTPGSGDDYPEALYVVMYYDKTAQALAALRAVLGSDVFHHALVEYGQRWIGRHPQPYDFFNTFDRVAGRDLSWFWTTWFYEAWPLDQAIDSVSTTADSVTITVRDRGLAPMPVLLAVTRADGTVQRVTVPVATWLAGARRVQVRVPRDPRVVRVDIDPEALFPDADRSNQAWRAP